MQDGQNIEKSRTRLDLAKEYLGKGQLEAAEAEAQKAVALHKTSEEAHSLLGFIDLTHAYGTQRMMEIESCLTGIDAEVQRVERDKHLAAAEAHFARACELAPDFGEAWAARGTIANLLEDHDRAVEYFTRALANPARLQNLALVRANLGWAYYLGNDLLSATKELLLAIQLQRGMCVATYRLGRVYFARKEWEKALQKFQEVVGQPSCPIQDAHLFLMKTHVELGATAALPEAGRACVALAPESCIAGQCRDLAAGVEQPELRVTPNPNDGPNVQ